jgi:hypothetical protein
MGKPRKNPLSEEHIRRIDFGSRAKGFTRGFQVHFSREGRLWTKFFSDRKWGAKDKSLRAARKFRDSLAATVPQAEVGAPLRESATGYSVRVRKNRDGTVTQYISASAALGGGRSVRKAFRIVKDTASAVQAALDWRIAMAHRRIRREKRSVAVLARPKRGSAVRSKAPAVVKAKPRAKSRKR